MTRVIIFQAGEELRGFSCEGHAGYAEHGKDIVCAAVSMISTNTVNAFYKFTTDVPIVHVEGENAVISCKFKKKLSPEGELLLKTFVLGVNTIMEQYGKKFLQVTYAQEC